jgi:hypothetical protein
MATFVAAFAVFGLAVLGMALGLLLQGRRLRGSCGSSGEACLCSPLAARHCALRRQRAERDAPAVELEDGP